MIPNNIILTYKDDNVPVYVFNNIKTLNPDKEVLFFTDKDITKFLLDEYDSSYADFFQTLNLGCTKGDFFRYCYLYKYGGYYCDIDIEHIKPLNTYIDNECEFFSVNSGACPNTTFQALLFSKKEHEIISNCIKDLMNPLSSKDTFYYTTRHMYNNIKQYLSINNSIIAQDYTKDGKIVRIGQEMHIINRWACLNKGTMIAFSRYQTYQKTNPGTKQEVGFFT